MSHNGWMSGADSTTPAPSARLGTALSRQAAVDAATRLYLAGEPVDMSALAAELGIGRSTLYRKVREQGLEDAVKGAGGEENASAVA